MAPHNISIPYNGGELVMDGEGLHYRGINRQGNTFSVLISAPFRVLARTRDRGGNNWGLYMQWSDPEGRQHNQTIPSEVIHGDGLMVRRMLASGGLTLFPQPRGSTDPLLYYLQTVPVSRHARCSDRLGWHDQHFITATETLGDQSDELYLYQSTNVLESAMAQRGTLQQWQDAIASPAVGNSRLMLALCTALAGPLLHLAGMDGDSGGFHLRGPSSCGKTTALRVAASVWGGPDYVRNWRTTSNGLEGLACLHNDGCLILDELSQLDQKSASEAAYLLANGQGKIRANRNGAAHKPAQWRLLFLSSGEESLSSLVAQSGRRTTAGQDIRLVELDADAGQGMGLFEILHDHASAHDFANSLKTFTASFYGQAGYAWLRWLVAQQDILKPRLETMIRQCCHGLLQDGGNGQIQRVARRFALAAVAGCLAAEAGVVPWQQDGVFAAIQSCFTPWYKAQGDRSHEERAILDQVRRFFERHGASRFQGWDNKDAIVPNRAGFVREEQGMTVYYLLPSTFKDELCAGFSTADVTRVLSQHGWLTPDSQGKYQHSVRIPALGQTRAYRFDERIWEGWGLPP